MTLRFAIRDDDVCRHTQVDVLRSLYGDVSKVCPVSFSCIPFVGGFDVDNYPASKWDQFDLQWREWQTKEIHPLEHNGPLVMQLREWCAEGRATIMLHGIHHDLYEFMQTKPFGNEIREAKRYLEGLFQRTVTVASAPNNSLGPSAAQGLADNGFNLLTAFGHRPHERPAGVRNYANFMRLCVLLARHGKRYRLTQPLDFGDRKEQACYEIGPSASWPALEAGFAHALRRGGNFVVATHYYHLFADSRLRGMMSDIVELARRAPSGSVEFVAAERLFEQN